jgi:hypothetical protein
VEFRRAASGSTDLPPVAAREADRPHVVPAQLPADLPTFAVRVSHLRRLGALLPSGDEPPPAVVITALAGTAGVGKPETGI